MSLAVNPSSRAVRKFSGHLLQEDPEDSLSIGLAAKVDWDESRKDRKLFVSYQKVSNDITSFTPSLEDNLKAKTQQLQDAWARFLKDDPEVKQRGLTSQIPDINLIKLEIKNRSKASGENARQNWQARLKEKFHNVCQHIDAHQTFFSVLPQDSQYVSIFWGTLNTIVQASVRYKEIAEKLECTIAQLEEDLGFWNAQIEYLPTDRMCQYLIQLYIEVFEFFTELFQKWSKSSWRRLKTSLKDNAIDEIFTTRQARIDRIQVVMAREAKVNHDRRFDQRLDHMETLMQLQASILSDQMKGMALMVKQSLTQVENLTWLGCVFQNWLHGIEQNGQHVALEVSCEQTVVPATKQASLPTTKGQANENAQSDDRNHQQNQPEILVDLTEFDTTLNLLNERLRAHMAVIAKAARTPYITVDASVQQRILRWTKTSGDVLWIAGPHGVERPSQNTLTAMIITALAKESNFKCLVYSCGLAEDATNQIPSSFRLVDLLLLFISGLAVMLPPESVALVPDFHQHSAELRHGDIAFDDALNLFCVLRSQVASELFIVIDGIEQLEDLSDDEHRTKFCFFIQVLCAMGKNTNAGLTKTVTTEEGEENGRECLSTRRTNNNTTKLCFTTDGHVDALAYAASIDLLDKIEYDLEADEIMADETSDLERF